MKIRIIINTVAMNEAAENSLEFRTSEVWRGDLEILPKGEYLTKISIMAEGEMQPICDIPFSPMVGYYQWIPPLMDNDDLEDVEEKVIENTEDL